MSGDYLVTWKIDIDADNPVEAAVRAQIIQRDPLSYATFFEVLDKKTGIVHQVDLGEDGFAPVNLSAGSGHG